MRCDVWSAQWEGALGQWLRGQLDARGIDAPAYGRYVLSLLTRPLQPADLSPDTIEGAKTWERRCKSKWGPVKIEALKRSAAVQCLVNASDEQSSGIEQLVDELCQKIKEVEEKGGSRRERASQVTRARRERRSTLSPQEMARLYYAAFPALGPAGKENLPQPCTWPCVPRSRRNSLHSAPNPPPRYYKPRRQHRPNNRPRLLPEWVTHGDAWDMDGQDPIEDFIKSVTVDEGYGTCDNTVTDDLISSKRLYERDSDSYMNGETDDMILCKDWVIEDDYCPPPKSRAEEESIAKFEAKFDRSLEALWPKQQSNTPDDEYQELPVDFQDLLSSPSDRMFDCCTSPDKPLPVSLTGSIWSNNEANYEYESNECVFRSEDCQPSMFMSDLGFHLNPNTKNNLWQQGTESYNKESMELIYNKLQPLNLDDSEENNCVDVNNLGFKDDTEFVTPPAQLIDQSAHVDPYSLHCYDDVLESVPVATTAVRSLTALNHNPLYSSFTEVIPKSTAGYVGDSIMRKNKLELPKPMKSSLSIEKDDEDLLTSMRTHFKPIKQESLANTQTIVNYADGVTFPIMSDLDDVKFSRSSSGTIFLESEIEPPKQYMEYRIQGIDYSRLDICPSATGSDDGLSSKDLVLKFKVCQTEKSVQTEQPGAKVELSTKAYVSENLKTCSSECSIASSDNSTCVDEKFGTILDTDSELESLQMTWIQCDECKSNSNPWVTDQSGWLPFKYNSTKIWSIDNNFCKACTELRAEEKAKRYDTKKALVYKEEAAREWDELLSDISYVHNLQTDESDEASTPSDICYIAPKEITVCASDGNFIESALLSQHLAGIGRAGDKWVAEGKGSNIVGSILDQSLCMYSAVGAHWEEREGRAKGGDRKRRHSAGGAGGAGKLRCPLPAPPIPPRPLHAAPPLAAVDRPLTR